MAEKRRDPHDELVRFKVTEIELVRSRDTGWSDDEAVVRAQGYRDIVEFVGIALSQPMTVAGFVRFVVGFLKRWRDDDDQQTYRRRVEVATMAVNQWLLTALKVGEPWLVRDAAPPPEVADPVELPDFAEEARRMAAYHALRGIWVRDCRAATAYLLANPLSRDLVAEPVRKWAGEPVAIVAAKRTAEAGEPPPSKSPPAPETAPKNKGGRPAEHNWQGGLQHARAYISENGLPEVIERIIELMREWFKANDGPNIPHDREIRRRATKEFFG